MMQSRRTFLQSGVAAAAVTSAAPALAAEAHDDKPAAASSGLSAVITRAGTAYHYEMASGKDLGNYTGPNFSHRCVEVRRPDLPLIVQFCPDTSGSRIEVRFVLGEFDPTSVAATQASNDKAAHLTNDGSGNAYTVQIALDGAPQGSPIPVKVHWWLSKWRYNPTPRPIVMTPTQMVAKRLLPPFTRNGPKAPPALNTARYAYAGPMDNAGVTRSMGDTGERPDIGLVTEIAANWLMNPDNADAARAMLAWGEAAGSVPMHFRDQTNGGVISLVKYPSTNRYYVPHRQGDPWLNALGDSSGWSLDSAHQPDLSSVPFYATGDSYFLANGQAGAIFSFVSDNVTMNGKAYISPGQTRDLAWGLRDLTVAKKMTELAASWGALPSWLTPPAEYAALLANQLAWYTGWQNDPAPSGTVFRACTHTGSVALWQEEYLVAAFMLIVLHGNADWLNFFLWKFGSDIARTNGTSGMPPAYPCPYYFPLGINLVDSFYPGQNTANLSNYYPDWGTAFDKFAVNDIAGHGGTAKGGQIDQSTLDALKKDPYFGGRFAQPNTEYPTTTYGAIAFAAYLDSIGIPVSKTYPELPKCLSTMATFVRANGSMPARWSIQEHA